MIEKRTFYINGSWVDPIDGRAFEVIDPSTEETAAVISLGSSADTDAAVAAARAAFPGWADTPFADRYELVEKLLEVYLSRSREMAEAISLEMGSPIDYAIDQHAPCGDSHIKNFLRAAKDFKFEHPLRPNLKSEYIIHEPIGVIGMITPWNWPINQIALKVAPALLTGCTMVLKPSEIAPLSGMLFAEMIDEAGFPAGVFNLVNGDGPGVGTDLSTHSDVDMISFTGSTRAGIAISKAAADTIKRVSLELGGKGANLIFPDARASAVEDGCRDVFENAGQSCNAPTRMLVHASIYDEAVERAAKAAEATRVASSHEPGDHIGPVVSQVQFGKIQDLIQAGIDEGARLVAGGVGRPDGLNRGYFVRPTVFADVTNDMTIAREEIFGPVISIMKFETEDEAVAIANDTVYGLTNYVQTEDGDRRNRLARKLRSGMVQMNGRGRGAGAPFGGVKQSGNGREGGVWGLHEFLEVKSIGGWAAE